MQALLIFIAVLHKGGALLQVCVIWLIKNNALPLLIQISQWVFFSGENVKKQFHLALGPAVFLYVETV